MPFPKEVYTQASEIIQQRRTQAENDCSRRRGEIFRAVPEIARLEREISNVGLKVSRMVLGAGKNAPALIMQLKQQNLNIQQKIASLLVENGYPENSLKPHYHCTICEDTGFNGPYRCECYNQLLTQIALEKLSEVSPISTHGFDDFSLAYYPTELSSTGINARENMQKIFRACKKYAEDFSLQSPGLLFIGSTGLGKTHLSLAIAKEVTKKGFGVLYVTAQSLLSAIEKEHFQREKRLTDTLDLASSCDFLILDDLGTEFQTQFTQTMVYNLLNTRIMKKLPFIVSTNLELQDIEKKYTQRVVSRLLDSCRVCRFYGNDIRNIQFLQRNKRI